MSDFIFGVDLDGVAAKYTEGLCGVVEDARGLTRGTLPPPNSWNFDNWQFVSGDFMKYHRKLVVEERGFLHLEPMENVSEVLNQLSELGVWIRIVTHRLVIPHSHGIVAADTVAWLDQHEIPYRDICFLERKVDVNCDLYVDDGPHNVKALQEGGKNVVTFNQPYNQDCTGPRVSTWLELKDYVLEQRGQA